MKTIIILLLPAFAYASITINIKAAPTQAQSLVADYGKDSNIISDQEIKTFNLTNNTLKAISTLYSGGIPLDVFVKSPTPWGDLYKSYNWQQVQRETKVKRTKIIKLKTEEVTVDKRMYTNNITQKAEFTDYSKSVVENHAIRTFKGKNMSLDIQYKVDLILPHNRRLHLNFSSHFDKDTEVKDSKTMQAVSEVKFTLEPNTTAKVLLNATKISMVVKVEYETSVSGDVAVNYNPRYKDHHFWAYDVKAVLKKADMSSMEKASETVVVEYFSDGQVIVVNMETGEIIKSEEAIYV